ncbi:MULTISPECIES: DUF4238 domain-containing protein [unclassified Paraburkholderia]|uniref:DUF4238 domain-containing protein n=1 Tax=unclassified Paraburkholderia TaxID=2615204 RepID=UPI0017C9287A|nr:MULTISPECIES: DUF4238 domain-containing protein [unclassified Paraburkholderia]MBB5441595.1 hypothetical protein [Paraburkholderia sp. WSM4177]MBB5481990.1 hypothetical protein [Paraburkholderia sp. WSM4180]
MPDNKKHHFVPKFYLKRFSSDGKSINAYVLKSSKKVLSANLANQCYRDYFYGKEPDFEHALGLLESEAAGLLKTIGETNSLSEKYNDRISLMFFILLQSARTELIAEELNDMTDKFFKHVFADRAKADGIDINDYQMVMQEPARLTLQMAAENYPMLLDLDFRLLLNSTKEGFITSDNPVVFYNQFMSFRKNVPSAGYASRGLQTFFPLDDKRMLCLFDGGVYRAPGNMGDTLPITDVRDVYELNTVQACSASGVLYFHDRDQDIDALCKKARPFFRTGLSNLDAYPQEAPPGGKLELLMTSRPEISTNMVLSFLSVRRSARQ